MDIGEVKLHSSGGDSSRCQTHRVYSATTNLYKILDQSNSLNSSLVNSPRSKSWRSTKNNNNVVIVHRPIRSVNQVPPEIITSTKSVENVTVNKATDKIYYQNICKTLSDTQIPKQDTSRSLSKKSCKLYVNEADESDDDLTIRNEGLRLAKNGYYESHESLRLSLTSLCSRETIDQTRREAFNTWLLRKERERREKLKNNNENKLKEPKMTPEQREELFKKWLERKQSIYETKKANRLLQMKKEEDMKKERILQQEGKISEWLKKKEEEQKEAKQRLKEREEKKSRLKEEKRVAGQLAYQQWLEGSKNKPLPVPLNKGILSMRGSMSSMYINPEPWRYPVDDECASNAW